MLKTTDILSAIKGFMAGKKNRIRKHNTARRNNIRSAGKTPGKPAAARAGLAFHGKNNGRKGPYKSNVKKAPGIVSRAIRRSNIASSLIKYPAFLIDRIVCFVKNMAVKKRIVFICSAAAFIMIAAAVTIALASQKPPASAVAGLTGITGPDPALAEDIPVIHSPALTPVPTIGLGPTASVSPALTDAPKPTAKPTQKPASADLNELVKFYQVEADKYYSGYHYSSNHYEYTDSELRMLAQVITREAGGERYEGQLAVGNVVMNRVLSGHWGKTIESVITAPKQFSYKPETTPKASCLKAAEDVLKNERWVVPQNTYFFKVDKTPGDDWGKYKYCVKIGNHCFYTHKVSGRSTKSGIPPALYERICQWPQYGCKPAKRVSRIQHMLSSLGYKVGNDGYFGKSTKDALVDFQKSKKIKADGVAGPATLKALIKAYGIDKYCLKYKS